MQLIILNIKNYSNSRGACCLCTKLCVLRQKIDKLKMTDNTNVNNSRTEHCPAKCDGRRHNSHRYSNFQYNHFMDYSYTPIEPRNEESIHNVIVDNYVQPTFNFYDYPIYNYSPWPRFSSFTPFTPSPPYNMMYQNISYQLQSFQSNSNRRYFHRPPGVMTGRMNPMHNSGEYIMSLRLWEKISNGNSKPKPGFIFTLMSYNVLAQDLLDQHPYLYYTHNQSALNWETRWSNLLEEIKKIKPDILCLQEVQDSHIKDYYSTLEALGYKGVFKKRTGVLTDGCAIYYKTDNVILIEQTSVEYLQQSVPLLNKNNVGIVTKFAPKLHPSREFVVATTHLLFNRRREDIRLAQMQVLLSEIERLSYKEYNGNENLYVPVILTGDLNSPPYADVYKFLKNNKLGYNSLAPSLLMGTNKKRSRLITSKIGITDTCQHADLIEKRKNKAILTRLEELKLIDIDNSDYNVQRERLSKISYETDIFATGMLSHKFNFESVYSDGGWRTREATTFQDEWLTVDYIFYSLKKNSNGDKLKLLSRYRLPTAEELDGIRIPNLSLGSDHLSLVAKFKLEF